ncbi:2Fe-2S iron-sulfur cluster-binding protein, partial [uncultured Spongiibacter sp.]|uniref:2Fe-2S iron-sulfur cluster-binding protein n=1 Tax=uncultured Spongiibacter sp. TaxID=870896 RepID=UPI0025848C9B
TEETGTAEKSTSPASTERSDRLKGELDDLLDETLHHRLMPGEGDMDLVGFIRILDGIGSQAPFTLEVLSKALVAQYQPKELSQRLGEAVAAESFFEVSLTRSGQTITVSSQQSLLDALEEAGHQPPHGCRMGICNSCSCGQRSGESQNQLNGEQLRGAGSVRLCVSRANSNIELDI